MSLGRVGGGKDRVCRNDRRDGWGADWAAIIGGFGGDGGGGGGGGGGDSDSDSE